MRQTRLTWRWNPQRLLFWPLFFRFFHLTEVIEGDILMTEPLRNVLKAGKSRAKRDIVSDMVKRWPDGVVPYKLDSSLSKCSLRIWYFGKETIITGATGDKTKIREFKKNTTTKATSLNKRLNKYTVVRRLCTGYVLDTYLCRPLRDNNAN